jgi:hypothetical protein
MQLLSARKKGKEIRKEEEGVSQLKKIIKLLSVVWG